MEQEKIEWLERYGKAARESAILSEMLERQRSETEMTGIPMQWRATSGGVDTDRLPRRMEKIEETKKKQKKKAEECWELYWETVEAIEMLRDENCREVLRRRYMMGENYEQIAEAMGLVARRVYQLHRKALKEISIEK